MTTARSIRIGLLDQSPQLSEHLTARQIVLASAENTRKLEAERDAIHDRLSDSHLSREESHRLLGKLQSLEKALEAVDSESLERRADIVLTGLGLDRKFFDQPVKGFSGGEISRVALAQLLIEQPDLWLLDEPTNHLDIDGIAFFEQAVRDTRAAVLVVSHDRRFLDNVTTATWFMEQGRIQEFPGAYTRAIAIREERNEAQVNAEKKQAEFIAKEEEYIRRYKAGQRARQAKGRLRRLERLERLERPAQQRQAMHLQFNTRKRLGDKVIRASDLSFGYDDRVLFQHLDLELVNGETLAILGPNGAGKTTLIDILLKKRQSPTGRIEYGESLDLGVMTQHDKFPDYADTPIDFIRPYADGRNDQELRDILGAMQFSGDDAFQDTHTLSGGEKKRLLLLALLMRQHNTLILDEPTNHLDIDSREALLIALSQFEGTLVLVSHDRYLVESIADRTLWIENGCCHYSNGGFDSAWSACLQRRQAEVNLRRQTGNYATATSNVNKSASVDKPRQPQWMRLKTDKLATAISELEIEIDQLEVDFSTPEVYRDPARVQELQQLSAEKRQLLEDMTNEYLIRE